MHCIQFECVSYLCAEDDDDQFDEFVGYMSVWVYECAQNDWGNWRCIKLRGDWSSINENRLSDARVCVCVPIWSGIRNAQIDLDFGEFHVKTLRHIQVDLLKAIAMLYPRIRVIFGIDDVLWIGVCVYANCRRQLN